MDSPARRALQAYLDGLSAPCLISVHPCQADSPPQIFHLPTPVVATTQSDLHACLEDVRYVLSEAGHRLTTTEILSGLSTANLVWAESTVKEELARGIKDGQLTKCATSRPRGYGLPQWSRSSTPQSGLGTD